MSTQRHAHLPTHVAPNKSTMPPFVHKSFRSRMILSKRGRINQGGQKVKRTGQMENKTGMREREDKARRLYAKATARSD